MGRLIWYMTNFAQQSGHADAQRFADIVASLSDYQNEFTDYPQDVQALIKRVVGAAV